MIKVSAFALKRELDVRENLQTSAAEGLDIAASNLIAPIASDDLAVTSKTDLADDPTLPDLFDFENTDEKALVIEPEALESPKEKSEAELENQSAVPASL